MSPVEFKLLEKAYLHYQETSDLTFSYLCRNADELFYLAEAACYLCEAGYIENVSEFVFESSISNFFDPIVFTLTNLGIEYMRANRES